MEKFVLFNKLKRLGRSFALDTETALIPHAFNGKGSVRLIQFYSPKYSFYLDTFEATESDWHTLTEFLQDPKLVIVFHNANFDIRVLQGCGIDIKCKIHDTMLQSYLLNNGIPGISHKLSEVAKRELSVVMDKTLQAQDWMSAQLNDADKDYAMKDVEYTYKCCLKMLKRVKAEDLSTAYEIECRAVKATIQMEKEGFPMDRYAMDKQVEDLTETSESSKAAYIEDLDGELMDVGHDGVPRNEDGSFNLRKSTTGSIRLGTKKYAGYNCGSAKQTLEYWKVIDIQPVDKEGKPSLDQKLLAEFRERRLVDTYLRWKKADKQLQMCQTLIKHQVEETGRIHSRFNQIGTFTGRYSSSSPNLQNVPRGDMRYLFNVKKGRLLVVLDYGGMELRALCSPRIANEKEMMDAFNAGVDIHRRTASLMFNKKEVEITDEERRKSKACNFGCAYGSGPQGLINYFASLGQIISYAEGEKFLKAWLQAYPKIAEWHKECRNRVDRGEAVRMVDGRRRFLHGEAAKHTTFANNLVQGSCASTVKLAMTVIYDRLPGIDKTARLIAQIHDEVVIECERDKAEKVLEMAKKVMEEAGKEIFGDEIALIAEGSYGESWGDAK